ncbi:hypothetical protein BUALT_Bualt14G0046500 [Buddleja alternifolia]|uniref:Uncharacterized protein n=1 Tax=Buddleja alternifolia TaxID=168488 RepID=A0AAV6WHT5_9LAMI|nr:hypothetical protein BUALT_Bualt14G0046500 [Buddleja alternifolia]
MLMKMLMKMLRKTSILKKTSMLGGEGDHEGGVGCDSEGDEDESDTSFVLDCPSWMLEDLEGPQDDDIFADKPADHALKIFKTLRAYLRDKERKREQEKQEKRTI